MKNGKKQAEFMRLYEPVHERFERFCRARVYGEMDHGDLINETLLVAFKKFESLQSEASFLSFLFGTAIRILANSKRKRKALASTPYLEQNSTVSSDRADQLIEVRLLHETLALLPVEQRESIILFELSGFSIKEIAQLHDVGESAVKQRLRRGRLKLAELLRVKQDERREKLWTE